MALKSLRYHCYCPFNHKSEGISIPRPNLSYFLGSTGRGAPRMHCNMKDGVNCRDWTRFPDPLWRHPWYGQVGSPSNPDRWRKRPNVAWFRALTETRERPPEIHEVHRTWPSQLWRKLPNASGDSRNRIQSPIRHYSSQDTEFLRSLLSLA
jgi:hypothetical protein